MFGQVAFCLDSRHSDRVESLVAVLSFALILTGLVGIVVPVLPGTLAVAVGLILWAGYAGDLMTWTMAGIGLLVLTIGQVAMYLIAGKRMKRDGVRNRSLLCGAVGAIIGMITIPVVGVLVGFVGGVFVAEWLTHRNWQPTWKATVAALKAAGLSMLIELGAASAAIAPMSIYVIWRYGW